MAAAGAPRGDVTLPGEQPHDMAYLVFVEGDVNQWVFEDVEDAIEYVDNTIIPALGVAVPAPMPLTAAKKAEIRKLQMGEKTDLIDEDEPMTIEVVKWMPKTRGGRRRGARTKRRTHRRSHKQ